MTVNQPPQIPRFKHKSVVFHGYSHQQLSEYLSRFASTHTPAQVPTFRSTLCVTLTYPCCQVCPWLMVVPCLHKFFAMARHFGMSQTHIFVYLLHVYMCFVLYSGIAQLCTYLYIHLGNYVITWSL
jgi:hypothetical protein